MNKTLIGVAIMLLMGWAQSFAQDSVAIVAVGEAEQEKEALALTRLKEEASYQGDEKAKIQELEKLFLSDFGFYRHLFEVSQKRPSYADSIADNWKEYRYVIAFRVFEKSDSGERALWGEYKVFDVFNRRTLGMGSDKIALDNIRGYGHKIANEMYRSITGNNSVFNTKIVFVSDRTSQGDEVRKELYIMDFDGERKQRITYNNSLIMSPAISPDNQKLLFTAIESRWVRSEDGKARKIQNPNLYLYDLKTRQQKEISSAAGINSGAVFSADGKDIYLTLTHLKNADIFKMNLQTKSMQRITKHFLDDVDPHINRDGSLMTFLSGRSGRAMIYTMDPSGPEKDVKRISFVGRFNASPRFSPDGREIVFSSWVDDRFDIYKIDSNGSNLARLTKDFGSNEEPWFSPDGQFIVFTSQRVINIKKAVQDIYIMNREGEIIKKLTENYGKTFTPRWSNILE